MKPGAAPNVTPMPDIPASTVDTGAVSAVREALKGGISDVERIKYSIKYEPLCEDRMMGIPKELHYKPLDGVLLTYLNDLTGETMDEGLNSILDDCCLESARAGFSHWDMPNPEKIRSFVNLRMNSDGPIIENIMGFCTTCGDQNLLPQVNLEKISEDDLDAKYVEPRNMKVPEGEGEVKFSIIMIRSGHRHKAKQLMEKDPGYIKKMFPGKDLTEEDIHKTVLMVIEYACSIQTINSNPCTLDDAIELCRDNLHTIKAITSFNDKYVYGMNLESTQACGNEKCASNTTPDKTAKGAEASPRGALHSIPIQPAIFSIPYNETQIDRYLDDD
jgi:hypothetical protein